MTKQLLFPQIWKILNKTRGSLENNEVKYLIFSLLFYRFISNDFVQYINKNEQEDFDYKEIELIEIQDWLKQELIKEKGYFIEPNDLFENVFNNIRHIENINETLCDIFTKITNSANGTESEIKISHLFDDFKRTMDGVNGSISEKNKLLYNIIKIVNDVELSEISESNIDIFGDIYEYLMHMYATSAGKKGGEFYTPQEVSELLAKLTLINNEEPNTVYDLACGSGSLLLKFKKLTNNKNLKYYGQEKNSKTFNLSRMNMFMHTIGYENWNISNGDTLVNPSYQDVEMDAIVANPPYQIEWDGDSNIEHVNDVRFNVAGKLAPKGAADWAFILHGLSMLSKKGSAAIIEWPSILTNSGAEREIRRYFIENNKIEAIIQMPSNLFYGTSISTVIILLKNNKTDTKVKFINASTIFKKAPKQNFLTDENIEEILRLVQNDENEEYFVKIVDKQEIVNNDYDLGVKTYCPSEVIKEEIDIDELNAFVDKNMEDILETMKKIKELRCE